MRTKSLQKALVEYLMAMTLPQELGVFHAPQKENPFISVNKRTGKKTCRVDGSELKKFRDETGIELTREEVMSCATVSDLETLVGSKADKVSVETLSGLLLHLTSVLGTVWNNLELVGDIDEISHEGYVDPFYLWPSYSVGNVPMESCGKCRVFFGRLKNILS